MTYSSDKRQILFFFFLGIFVFQRDWLIWSFDVLILGFDFGCSLLLGYQFCDGRMNAKEICLCFILVVDKMFVKCR
jgi:hypothetical protein